MTVTQWFALVLQFASLALLRVFLGKRWLRRPATLLVIASVVYDGVIQVLLSFPSVAQWDYFRNGIASEYEGDAMLLLSAGMLAFTAGFLLTGRGRQEPPSAESTAACAKVLDWRLLALACVPLLALTYAGRGYNGDAAPQAPGTVPSPTAAGTFFVIVVTLTAVSFLLRHGTRLMVTVLAAQSLILAAAGERIPVIGAAAALIICCARAGLRPSRRQVTAMLVLTVALTGVISMAKAGQARRLFEQDTGAAARASALGGALISPPAPAAGTPGFAGQAAWRLDGTVYTAGILQARASGHPLLPASAVPESLLLAVPRALWPGKPDTGNALDPYQAQITAFGLAPVNYMPGVAGLYAGYLAAPWLLAFLAFLGMAWGAAERWILTRVTPARLVLLAGSALAGVTYEAGLPALLGLLRPAAVIAVTAWLAGMLRRGPRAASRRRGTGPGGAAAQPGIS